jgi:hypothetical protein
MSYVYTGDECPVEALLCQLHLTQKMFLGGYILRHVNVNTVFSDALHLIHQHAELAVFKHIKFLHC